MPITIADRVVVLDYGEVISTSPPPHEVDELVRCTGVDRDAFLAAYQRHRDALDRGAMTVREYWTRIAADLGVTWSDAQRNELWVRDFRSWLTTDPGTVELIAELRAGGTRLALLSNAGFDFAGPFRNAPFTEGFEEILVSAEIGMLKPDPGIYEYAARRLGISFDRFVFVDNRAENVEALVALGGIGHVFVGAGDLRAFLEDLAADG